MVKQNACINQLARAQAEYAPAGYVVRGTIVTHINVFEPPAGASADSIRVVFKDAMIELGEQIRLLLSLYRDRWSLDDVGARAVAGERIQTRIPQTGWLIRALDCDERFVAAERPLAEWAAENG